MPIEALRYVVCLFVMFLVCCFVPNYNSAQVLLVCCRPRVLCKLSATLFYRLLLLLYFTTNSLHIAAQSNIAQSREVVVDHGTFAWSPKQAPLLHDINLSFKGGELVVVVGSVGCGKSSLLQALLGEMYPVSGTTSMPGRVAFTA